MPTFFSRRYMRGKPKRTERLVGAFLLVLVAFIVGSFLLTGGLFGGLVNRTPSLHAAKDLFGISERPLFVAAAENMKAPPPPHEMRTAQAMLPLPPEQWTRMEVTPVRVGAESKEWAALKQADAALANQLVSYAASWAYLGSYRNGDKTALVTIADAGTPEAAFGLSRTVRPKEIGPFSLGRGGWISEKNNAAGFWAGRYYTQVVGHFPFDGTPAAASAEVPSADAAAQPTTQPVKKGASVEQLARLAAALQINYGGPFWADAVLPIEGRVEDSLLYVRQAGLGIDALTDCWLAEYGEGLKLAVVHPSDPAKLIGTIRTWLEKSSTVALGEPTARLVSDEEGETAGSEAKAPGPGAATQPASALPADLVTVLGPEVAAGQRAGQTIVAYATGPYVFVAAGPKTEMVVALAKSAREHVNGLAPADSVAAAPAGAGKPHKALASGQAKFAEIEGGDIHVPAKVERFTDNLYEKIDGREGQFRAFGFVEMRFGQYQDTRKQQTFDVYIYDMAQPNNAMGIYMAEKSEGAPAVEIGAEGYISGANVYYYKNKYYVNVLGPSDAGKEAADSSKKIAGAIAETIADAGGSLWANSLLPKPGRVGSIRYQPTSALAHDFLERFFFASYQLDGAKFEMFIHKAPGPAEAAGLFKKYAEETAKYETVVSREKTEGGETLLSDSLGTFTVAFHKGVYFAGVANCKHNRELALKQAAALRDKLNINDQGEPAPPKSAQPKESEGGDHGY